MSPSAASATPSAHDLPPEYHNVVCIGAGVTTLALVCQLQMRLGETDFVVLEREGGVGGTWYNNTYPGAGVSSSEEAIAGRRTARLGMRVLTQHLLCCSLV